MMMMMIVKVKIFSIAKEKKILYNKKKILFILLEKKISLKNKSLVGLMACQLS